MNILKAFNILRMETILKQLNHDVRNLIPISCSNMEMLNSNMEQLNKKQLLGLIDSLNETLNYFTECVLKDYDDNFCKCCKMRKK